MSDDQAQAARRYAGFETIPIEVTVRVGNARCRLGDLQALEPGRLIVLHRRIGEPFELLAGAVLLGRGEPVAHADGIAVKLVEIQEGDDDAAGA